MDKQVGMSSEMRAELACATVGSVDTRHQRQSVLVSITQLTSLIIRQALTTFARLIVLSAPLAMHSDNVDTVIARSGLLINNH